MALLQHRLLLFFSNLAIRSTLLAFISLLMRQSQCETVSDSNIVLGMLLSHPLQKKAEEKKPQYQQLELN